MNFGDACVSVFEARHIARCLDGTEKGVYAWYLPIPEVDRTDEFDADQYFSFYKKFWESQVDHGKSDRYMTKIRPHLRSLENRKLDKQLYKHWQTQIAVLAHFAPPIYIGKSSSQGGLRERLSTEYSMRGGFLGKAKKHIGIDRRFNQERFIIKVFNMTKFYEAAGLASEDLEVLILEMEKMLLWQHQPVFNIKRGN